MDKNNEIKDYKRFMSTDYQASNLYLTRSMHEHYLKNPSAMSLAIGMPDVSTFPLTELSYTFDDGSVVKVNENEMKKLSPHVSIVPLLEKWIRLIHEKYHTPPHQIAEMKKWKLVITNGAMSALHSIFMMLLNRGDNVLCGEYTYPGARENIWLLGANPVGIPMDTYGIIPQELSTVLEKMQREKDDGKNVKMPTILYTIPTGQNPTGSTTPVERKREIYQIARSYNLLIVEDDPYYFIQFNEGLTESYQSIDVDGRVLRIDSVSKLLAPGIRIGWISGPSYFIKHLTTLHGILTGRISSFSQSIVANIFERWGISGLKNQIVQLKYTYKLRRDTMIEVLKKYGRDLLEWNEPQSGMYIWLKLKHAKDSMFLANFDLVEKYKVYTVPCKGFYFGTTDAIGPYIRICFATLPMEHFDEVVKRLCTFIEKEAIHQEELK